MTSPSGSIVVVKVGGSLLDWPSLPSALGRFLASRSGDRLVLVPGGGGAADFIRRLDARHRLGEPVAHALALRSLDLTAHALAAVVAGLEVVEELEDREPAWRHGRVPVLAPRRFLDADDARPDALAHSWLVTSDAIAARLAVRLGADELVLLKSAPVPPGADRAAAARLGLVDPAFCEAAQEVGAVVYVNLRDGASTILPR
jgi:aspartokinase-like uncharacterized kinase